MTAGSATLQSAYATLHIDQDASFSEALNARDTLISRYSSRTDRKTASMNAARTIAIRNAFKTICEARGWEQGVPTSDETSRDGTRAETKKVQETQQTDGRKRENTANTASDGTSPKSDDVKEEFHETAQAAKRAAASAYRNAKAKRASLRNARESDRKTGQKRYDSILSNRTLKLFIRIAILAILIAMGTKTISSYHGMLPGIVTGTLTIIEAVSGKFSAFAVAGMARTARGYYRYIRWFAIPIARFSKKTAKRIVKTARKAIGRR